MIARPRPDRVPTIHRIIINVIIVLALLGLMENAARIYGVAPRDPFSLHAQFAGDEDHGNFLRLHESFIRDPELFWRFRPNRRFTYYNRWKNDMVTESTNSKGFRGRPEFPPKGERTFRIAALGDSWTFGVLVADDETYPYQLGRLFGASPDDRRFEVLNLGCVGYSSYQGKVLLREKIDELKPDLVIVCFGSNDARRTRLFSDREQPATGEWAISLQQLLSKSALYNLLRNNLLKLKKHTIRTANDSPSKERWPQRVSPKDYENNLREIISMSKARKCDVMLMSYLSSGPYREEAEKLAEQMKIPFVDVYAILHTNPAYSVEELSIDYPRDRHPNAKGYSLIAQALYEKIRTFCN